MTKPTELHFAIAALLCAIWLLVFVGGVHLGQDIGQLIFD